jgi:integrase
VRYSHAILRRALQAAVKWQLLPRNVADAAEPPTPKQSRNRTAMRTWTAGELRTFLDGMGDHRLFPLFLLLAQTGMRRGEAIGGRWQDVSLDHGRWAIEKTLVFFGGRIEESQPKTDHGRRNVVLDAGTVDVLRAWRKRQLEERLAFGPDWEDSGRVFTREDAAALHPERVSELFDRLVRRSGLPRIRLHDLRRTHATLAFQAGVHPKVVSERLGHASVTITVDTYSQSIPPCKRTQRPRWRNWLDSTSSTCWAYGAHMFGGQGRYEQFLERNGGAATVYVLQSAHKARNPRKGMKKELRGAAVGASLAVQDFASFLWPDRKTGPAPVRAFVKALGGAGSGMVPAHLVLTLALLNNRLSHTQPGSLDSLMENAAEIIEVGSASERWVVDFGPVPTT